METENKKPFTQRLSMPRVNTRIRKEQQEFVKTMAQKENKTEGEIFREIIDYYINKK